MDDRDSTSPHPIVELGTPWHTGVVVDDVAAAMARYAAATGCRWAPPRTQSFRMWTPEGEAEATVTATYTVGAEPRLEVVSGSPGSLWDGRHLGEVHVCYWSDDVARDSAALTAVGLPVAVRRAGEVVRGFVYHDGPEPGFRIELIDRAGKAATDERLSGRSLESGQAPQD